MKPPRFVARPPACAWAAVRMLRERETSYPARVERGELSAQKAADSLAIARALAAQWLWAVDPSDPPFPDPRDPAHAFGVDEVLILEQIQVAAGWAASRSAASPADPDLAERADLTTALLWYQDLSTGAPLIVNLTLRGRRPGSPLRYVPWPDDAGLYRALGFTIDRRLAA